MCVYSLYTIPARTQRAKVHNRHMFIFIMWMHSRGTCTLASRMQTEGALCTVRLRLM